MIILCVNLNFGITVPNFPIFAGDYREFSVDWYRSIGSTIVSTFIILTYFSAWPWFLTLWALTYQTLCSKCWKVFLHVEIESVLATKRELSKSCNLTMRISIRAASSSWSSDTPKYWPTYGSLWCTQVVCRYFTSWLLLHSLLLTGLINSYVSWHSLIYLVLKCYKKPPPYGLELSG